MKSPEYYVQNLELNIDPNLEDVDFGATSLDFEVDDVPEYDDDLNSLVFEANIGLNLKCYPVSAHSTNREEEEEVGDIDVEIVIVLEGEENEFEELIVEWEEEGYRAIDYELRLFIESGIVTEVFSPISNLVKNSYRGVLPGMTFTEPPEQETQELDELPVDKGEFSRSYLAENLKIRLFDYIVENVDDSINEIDIDVGVSENYETIDFEVPEELEEELVENHFDQINEIITAVSEEFIRKESDDDIEVVDMNIGVGEPEVIDQSDTE